MNPGSPERTPTREIEALRNIAVDLRACNNGRGPNLPLLIGILETAEAALAAPLPAEGVRPTTESDYNQQAVDVIQNLSMLVRRLCHRLNKHEPKSQIVTQSLNYLRGERLQGSILREACGSTPECVPEPSAIKALRQIAADLHACNYGHGPTMPLIFYIGVCECAHAPDTSAGEEEKGGTQE